MNASLCDALTSKKGFKKHNVWLNIPLHAHIHYYWYYYYYYLYAYAGSCSVSSCTQNPCENGAECIEDWEGWYCDCPTNYAGRYCEKKHCTVNPCLHGGTCVVTEDGTDYVCICPYGRHGVDCSLVLKVTNSYFSGK